jgi:hypothetical protein
MRTTVTFGAVMLLAATALAATTGNSSPWPEKTSGPAELPTYEGRIEGDTIEDPFIIYDFPFIDSGDTCPFMDDYDEVCPYESYGSPDVVYRYEANYSSTVTIDLCDSQYDTKVYVYENAFAPGVPHACNDDYPGCGPDGYRSWLMTEFTEGNTYYIVVDGYGGGCGVYELYIEEHLPCAFCPSGGFVEPEPWCIDPENDVWNGGCNSEPPVFDYLEPDEDVVYFCGTSGTYYQGGINWRDTDWFQIDLANESEIRFNCVANFPVLIGIIDGRDGCESLSFYSYVDTYTCGVAELTETLPPGTWWLWIGPLVFEGILCGTEYMCELEGYSPATPVEDASWSSVKALYR